MKDFDLDISELKINIFIGFDLGLASIILFESIMEAPEQIRDLHVAWVQCHIASPNSSFAEPMLTSYDSLYFFGLRASHKKIFARILPRKEVIQPHLPVRLPCYDFTPVTNPALGRCFQMVSSRTSGVVDFHGVTGGVYKTRERIQRSVLICVY